MEKKIRKLMTENTVLSFKKSLLIVTTGFLLEAGVIADLDPPRIWTLRSISASGFGPPPRPNPPADMGPPLQIWTPLPNFSFKHPLYHIW